MKKPIVMQILPRLKSGGVEKSTVDMAKFLATLDDTPTYVVSAGGSLVSEIEESGCHHITLPVQSKNPLTIFINGLRLAYLVKKTKTQLMHVHSRAPAWSVLIASKLTGTSYISTYHGAYKNKGKLSNWYNSAMLRGRLVIANSDFISRIISKDHGHRHPAIMKINQGIDTQLFAPQRFTKAEIVNLRSQWHIPENVPLLLVIGRITTGKRYDLAIQALSHINRQDAHLMIVGSDYGRQELSLYLKELARSEGVGARVHFISNCLNIPLIYEAADLVLFPTQMQESFGRISAEAGAMEKIVIASANGAIPEVIKDGETGYLFPSKDLKALIDRINIVMEMPMADRLKIGKKARSRIVQNYSAGHLFHQMLELYVKYAR